MSFFGCCSDCDRHGTLSYKPDVPLSEQDKPSVCLHCKEHREEYLRQVSESRTPVQYEAIDQNR